MTQICHLKPCWPCLELVEWLGLGTTVSDYRLRLWGNARSMADGPEVDYRDFHSSSFALLGFNCFRGTIIGFCDVSKVALTTLWCFLWD